MQIATLTGPSDNVPQDNDAAKAAVKALNAAGGVQGRPLELVTCDDKFDPNAAADCARKAVSDKVAAVVALNSGFGDKVIPILAAAGIPSVGDNLISAAEFVSPIVYPISGGAITGTSGMAYAVAHAGATKIRPMVVDVAAAKGLLPFIQGTAALFPKATMLKDIPVPPQATDVTSQASAAAADGADGAFFVVGAGAAASLTRAMRTAGFKGVLASGTQSITQQEIKDLGHQADGLLLVSAMPPPTYTQNASVKQFTDDLKAAGGVRCAVGRHVARLGQREDGGDGPGEGDNARRPRSEGGARLLRDDHLPRPRLLGLLEAAGGLRRQAADLQP